MNVNFGASDNLLSSMLDSSSDIKDETLTPKDDGGYVDNNSNILSDPETWLLINSKTGNPYIQKSIKYAFVSITLALIITDSVN
ncbi:hypothetical protein ACO3TA_00020 [Methanocaldococcus sp. 28A]